MVANRPKFQIPQTLRSHLDKVFATAKFEEFSLQTGKEGVFLVERKLNGS